MKRLVLMRHAKSSWAQLGAADHGRPLNGRGRLASALMGAWFAEQSWNVDLALISTSARTRETWALMGLTAGAEEFRDALYHAEPNTLWEAARSASDAIDTVLILAHNPGLEELLGSFPRGPRRLPTAAVGVLEIDGGWTSAGPKTAKLAAYEEPKGLV